MITNIAFVVSEKHWNKNKETKLNKGKKMKLKKWKMKTKKETRSPECKQLIAFFGKIF